ncbi:RICIN domain-containing protein [Streptomyces sp. WI03-4A]|uniref:RICIN domain-containing protein n=1 Tax=Streptomyces sp. WI03-4A TaxID=3028706 RepID=UPI0029B7B0B6|nr:RICIN domain-containing protein [Streptomyces sp. WI03-4A]MDX2595516.1 RICIN domain-containing protein [Streptomyces sp. WI03-4A]
MARPLPAAASLAALSLTASLATGLLTASPAQAATGTGLAGKCLDVAGANSADGTPVQLYDCNGTAAQRFQVVPVTQSAANPDLGPNVVASSSTATT